MLQLFVVLRLKNFLLVDATNKYNPKIKIRTLAFYIQNIIDICMGIRKFAEDWNKVEERGR